MSKRARLLDDAKKQFKTRILEIPLADGSVERVGVRTPSLGQAKMFSDDGPNPDRSRLAVRMVIQCSFDPDTDKPLFDEADEELLLSSPAQNSFIEPILTGITDLISEAKNAPKA